VLAYSGLQWTNSVSQGILKRPALSPTGRAAGVSGTDDLQYVTYQTARPRPFERFLGASGGRILALKSCPIPLPYQLNSLLNGLPSNIASRS